MVEVVLLNVKIKYGKRYIVFNYLLRLLCRKGYYKDDYLFINLVIFLLILWLIVYMVIIFFPGLFFFCNILIWLYQI